jgi:hypothetical protein
VHRLRSLAPLVVVFVASGCRNEPEPRQRRVVTSAPSMKPLDRLAPGELRPGTSQVFGLEVPWGMVVRGQFASVAYVEGNVPPEDLANYVRERVIIDHVEIGAARTVFPNARIKKGPADRFFQIEVIAGKGRTELVVTDVTPRSLPVEHLSDEERWRRVGRRPDGRPLDITELK